MFGDYSIAQAAKVLHSSEEVVRQVVERGSFPAYRQFWLFGPWRLKADFVDDLAPAMIAQNRRLDAILGTQEERQRKLEELKRQEAEAKAASERMRQEHDQKQQQMLDELWNLSAEYVKRQQKNEDRR